MNKRHYPNLYQALKARDRLWLKKGQRLRAYKDGDGRYYLTSMGREDYWSTIIKQSSQKECTEENLIGYIYRFQHSNGYYPTLASAMRFFNASEELMEAFIEDCAVVVLGTNLIPLAEIEEIYMIHHPEEKKEQPYELVVQMDSLDNTKTIPEGWNDCPDEDKEEEKIDYKVEKSTTNISLREDWGLVVIAIFWAIVIISMGVRVFP